MSKNTYDQASATLVSTIQSLAGDLNAGQFKVLVQVASEGLTVKALEDSFVVAKSPLFAKGHARMVQDLAKIHQARPADFTNYRELARVLRAYITGGTSPLGTEAALSAMLDITKTAEEIIKNAPKRTSAPRVASEKPNLVGMTIVELSEDFAEQVLTLSLTATLDELASVLQVIAGIANTLKPSTHPRTRSTREGATR